MMCRAVACTTCGKTTWAGCGQHVDAVMASVPRADRCTCGPDTRNSPKTRNSPETRSNPRTRSSKGMFAGLFGRRG
jgi:hypothetical protein